MIRTSVQPRRIYRADEIERVVDLVRRELVKATGKHRQILTVHEGVGVVLEEYREFEAEVFRQQIDESALRKEALHVAAMGARFVLDLLVDEQGAPPAEPEETP